MNKFLHDRELWASRYVSSFKNCRCRAELAEEIDAANARALSIEMNRDMSNENWIIMKNSWIKVAEGLDQLKSKMA